MRKNIITRICFLLLLSLWTQSCAMTKKKPEQSLPQPLLGTEQVLSLLEESVWEYYQADGILIEQMVYSSSSKVSSVYYNENGSVIGVLTYDFVVDKIFYEIIPETLYVVMTLTPKGETSPLGTYALCFSEGSHEALGGQYRWNMWQNNEEDHAITKETGSPFIKI